MLGKLLDLGSFGSILMFSKIVFALAFTSVAAVLLYYMREAEDETKLRAEAAGSLDELREHLFRP